MDAHERAAAIEDQKRPSDRGKIHLWVRGQRTPFDVWLVPVDLLVLNIDNRRFRAERKYFESKLGHDLDPENSEVDALSVESILLDSKSLPRVEGDRVVGTPSKDAIALQADWEGPRGQESPFWIRPDGVTRNGNRRLAMVRRMRRAAGSGDRNHVEVVILDEDIDEDVLFEMEQREQLTEDFKVRYTDINLLLAVKDAARGKGVVWSDPASIDSVAGELQHVMRNDKRYAIVQLWAVRYMDAFLDDMGQPEAFDLLLRQIERFRDVGKAMKRVVENNPEREEDMLDVCFSAVRAGLTHLDIRKIKNMFVEDRDRFDELVDRVREAEGDWEPSVEIGGLGDPAESSPPEEVEGGPVEEDDDDEDEEAPGPTVIAYPKARVAEQFDTAIDAFTASLGVDAKRLLTEVVSRLEILGGDPGSPLASAVRDSEQGVPERLQEIVDWAESRRDLLP